MPTMLDAAIAATQTFYDGMKAVLQGTSPREKFFYYLGQRHGMEQAGGDIATLLHSAAEAKAKA